jgi:hypothetical protein
MSAQIFRVIVPSPIKVPDNIPKPVYIGTMAPTDTIAITSTTRYSGSAPPTGTGTALTGADALSGNTYTLSTIWNSGETRIAGSYCIRTIITDSTPTVPIIETIDFNYTVLP